MKKGVIISIICLLTISIIVLRNRTSEEILSEHITIINILISLDGDINNREIFEKHISLFNKENTNIQAVPFFVPSDTEAIIKLIYEKGANQRYDIAYLGANQIHSLIGLDLIEPLDSYITRDFGISWLEDFYPISMANSIVKGEIWSIPIIRNAIVALFNQKQYNYNKETISLEELIQQTQELNTNKENNKILVPLWDLVIEYMIYNNHFKDPYFNENHIKLNIIDENKIKVLDDIRVGIQQNRIIDYSINDFKGIKDFANGYSDILVCNTYYANKLLKEIDFPISVASLMVDSNVSYPLVGSNLYLIKQPFRDNYDYSWDALKSLWEIVTNDIQAENKGNIPLTVSNYNNIENKNGILNYNKSYINAIYRRYNGVSGLAINQNTKIKLLLENSFRKILNEEENTYEAIVEIQNLIDDVLNN